MPRPPPSSLPTNGMTRHRLVEAETGSVAHPSPMPPNRLMTLLEQAVAFQIDSGRYHPKVSVPLRLSPRKEMGWASAVVGLISRASEFRIQKSTPCLSLSWVEIGSVCIAAEKNKKQVGFGCVPQSWLLLNIFFFCEQDYETSFLRSSVLVVGNVNFVSLGEIESPLKMLMFL